MTAEEKSKEIYTIDVTGNYDYMVNLQIAFRHGAKWREENPVDKVQLAISYEDLKEALRVGVNIGMQNIEEPRHEGDYNFNQAKALKECEEYLTSLQKSNP